VIQVWRGKHSATVIRLNSVFAHDGGLPMPQDWITALVSSFVTTRVFTGGMYSVEIHGRILRPVLVEGKIRVRAL
jgi:hypothetical protein